MAAVSSRILHFDAGIAEQMTGSKTYEFDTAANSDLLVSAMNPNMKGGVSITVYENGQQRTQDFDTAGYARVIY